jgi:hypothetical protein
MDVIALAFAANGRKFVFMDCSTDAADRFATYEIVNGDELIDGFESDNGDAVYSEYTGRLKGV